MVRKFLVTASLFGLLAVDAGSAGAQSGVSVAACEADFQAMAAAIAANRASAVAEIDRQIAETEPDRHPALKELREAAWTQEEHERVQADHFRRDCLQAAAASSRRPAD